MNDGPIALRIARNKRWRRVLIATGIIFAVSAAWIFRPYWRPDESLVEPRLRALKKPYRTVSSDFMFDGGSSSVTITDADGRTEHFFIPCSEGHRTVYVRVNPRTHDGEIPALNHAATLQELVAILSEHCDDILDRHNLERMSGRLRDKLRIELWTGWEKVTDWWKGLKF